MIQGIPPLVDTIFNNIRLASKLCTIHIKERLDNSSFTGDDRSTCWKTLLNTESLIEKGLEISWESIPKEITTIAKNSNILEIDLIFTTKKSMRLDSPPVASVTQCLLV